MYWTQAQDRTRPRAGCIMTNQTLRLVTLCLCAAATAFWIYTFYVIAQLPAGDGTGFQWIAEVPLTAIFLFAVLPAAIMSFVQKTIPVATLFAAAAVVLYAVLWMQLLEEFKPG
jgi:hypothetical protein